MFSQGADVVEVSGSGQTFVDHCMRNLEDDGGCMAGGMLECVCLHVYLCVCVCVCQCRLMPSLSGRHRRRGNLTSITGLASNTHSV